MSEPATPIPETPVTLWSGDTGTLHELTRRALLELLKGPYLSGAKEPRLWSALVADEPAVRSRLNDLFLELVLDPADEIAFTRKVRTDELDVPAALRSEQLPFIDTAMLLTLRQLLLAAPGERRVIVGREEVYERLLTYNMGDEATFTRNLNAAWNRMKSRLRVVHDVSEDRVEISPALRFLIDEDRVRSLTQLYRELTESGTIPDDGAPATPTTSPTPGVTQDDGATPPSVVDPPDQAEDGGDAR